MDLDVRVRVAERPAVVRGDVGHAPRAHLQLLDAQELVPGLLGADAVAHEAALGVVDEAEALVGAVERDDVHEARRVGRVGADLAVDLDEALHEDGDDLLAGEGVPGGGFFLVGCAGGVCGGREGKRREERSGEKVGERKEEKRTGRERERERESATTAESFDLLSLPLSLTIKKSNHQFLSPSRERVPALRVSFRALREAARGRSSTRSTAERGANGQTRSSRTERRASLEISLESREARQKERAREQEKEGKRERGGGGAKQGCLDPSLVPSLRTSLLLVPLSGSIAEIEMEIPLRDGKKSPGKNAACEAAAASRAATSDWPPPPPPPLAFCFPVDCFLLSTTRNEKKKKKHQLT